MVVIRPSSLVIGTLTAQGAYALGYGTFQRKRTRFSAVVLTQSYRTALQILPSGPCPPNPCGLRHPEIGAP
jgi:hypothetical protein